MVKSGSLDPFCCSFIPFVCSYRQVGLRLPVYSNSPDITVVITFGGDSICLLGPLATSKAQAISPGT